MKALHRVLEHKKPVPLLIFTAFCLMMLWAAVVPTLLHTTKVPLTPIFLAFALTGTATLIVACWRRRRLCLATAMSCDRQDDGKKDLVFVIDAGDTADGILTGDQRFALLKKGFAAAKIVGGEQALLAKYERRYGHRPQILDLVRKAFGATCDKG